MSFSVPEKSFSNITEIRQVGPNTIEVYTANDRRVRINACESVRGGVGRYMATYDELLEIEPKAGTRLNVWCVGNFPWQYGDTLDECLRAALRWVDERGKSRNE
jgi:hypothetical protein